MLSGMAFTSLLAALVSTVATVTSVALLAAQPAERPARASPRPTANGAVVWMWPLDPPPPVLRPFDPPDQPWGGGHRGVDLGAAVGGPVRSPADGRVVFAGLLAGRGIVVVRHSDGLRSTFEPVGADLPVGTQVAAGDRVGSVADQPGHCAPRTCLHWGVLRGGTYLDPLAYLRRASVILLPLS